MMAEFDAAAGAAAGAAVGLPAGEVRLESEAFAGARLERPGRGAGQAEAALLQRLLALARWHAARGEVRQAEDIYWDLADEHAGTAEGAAARQWLMELADCSLRAQAPHVARAIYERLLAAGG
jgi:hypothetical protein